MSPVAFCVVVAIPARETYADRLHASCEIQIADHLGALVVDIRRNVVNKAVVFHRQDRAGVVRRGTYPHRIACLISGVHCQMRRWSRRP